VTDAPATDPPATSRGLLLLALGVVAGAVVAMVAAGRQHAAGAGGAQDLAAQELALRDERPWAYETTVLVHRQAGEIAVHVHEQGGLPGLVTPLEGPPLDRVDWLGPGGARLRLQVHPLAGGSRTEMTLKAAPGEGDHHLEPGLEGRLRSALASLRNELERER
jgi:hypothetical protein